jgi:hypothetical protein
MNSEDKEKEEATRLFSRRKKEKEQTRSLEPSHFLAYGSVVAWGIYAGRFFRRGLHVAWAAPRHLAVALAFPCTIIIFGGGDAAEGA